MRPSRAARRCSSRRAAAAWAKGSKARSASGGPRQSASPGRGRRGGGRVAARHRPARPLDQRLEAVQVELVGRQLEHVAGRPRHQPAAVRCRRPEQLPQPRDVDLDDLGGGGRRRLAPEAVDQPVGRDDLVAVQEQERQQGALLGAAQGERPPIGARLQRSKDQELHCRPRPPAG